jgi:hypothetical protein
MSSLALENLEIFEATDDLLENAELFVVGLHGTTPSIS